MNRRQLEKMGIPEFCVDEAVRAVTRLANERQIRGAALREQIRMVVENPAQFLQDEDLSELATTLTTTAAEREEIPTEPIGYRTWGADIDPGAHAQMREACHLPGARGAALMPDAHIGYGLPIGGVLAMENAVVPYAVGVDIACRMKLSIVDIPADRLREKPASLIESLEANTRFGIGSRHQQAQDHAVMHEDWSITRITREHKDKAWTQLGTSGSGNHFVEWGLVTLAKPDLGLEAGEYLALLSHSGSRGAGAAVCSTYSSIAQSRLPKSQSHFGRLAWLSLDSEAGQEYWNAMNLMGRYAAANHEVLHRLVIKGVGGRVIAGVENHHNFAWLERHGGRDLIVHRKGATPAGPGVLGIIPGSMGTAGYVVRGRGEAASFCSASHGAGRCMSRTQGKASFSFSQVKRQLAEQGITVLSAGSDEVPGVYKDIEAVMAEQQDLVDVVARFDPKIVKMCGDNSRAED